MDILIDTKLIFEIVIHGELQKIADEVSESMPTIIPDLLHISEGLDYNSFITIAINIARVMSNLISSIVFLYGLYSEFIYRWAT